MKNKFHILFLCTGNSCRSQMAEGWARHLYGEKIEAYSAGIEKHGLNESAVRVMRESEIDISHHRSKALDDLERRDFDLVITVCGHAEENCPVFPDKTKIVHKDFDDPPRLAESLDEDKEILEIYRRVRDEIEEFVRDLPDHFTEFDVTMKKRFDFNPATKRGKND